MANEQQGVSPATAGGVPARWRIERHHGEAFSLHEGGETRGVLFGEDQARRVLRAVNTWLIPVGSPDPRDDMIERLKKSYELKVQDFARETARVSAALCEGDEAREEWKRADAEIERLRGELAKANTGWEVWRDEQRAHDRRRDNELRVVAERLHELIGDTEPRRWRVGDPEPEIGTTVWRRADKYTRSSNGWRRVDIHTGYASWAWILSVGSEIVEAIADPKDGA